jgi:sterol desaturase/sphingolipid hydroxylase (fatty acid hydroxylase superfamily)
MARKYVSNKDESLRIFRSDLFERLSYVHPAVPHLIYIPLIGLMLYLGSVNGVEAGAIGWLFALGVLLWTAAEYVVHRFVFHATQELEDGVREIVEGLEPGEAAYPKMKGWRMKLYFLAHGVHHDFPNDSRRLVMPPSVSIPLAVIFWVLFRLVFGPAAGAAVFAGFVAGYLAYDTIHYAVHHFSLHSRVMLYLKKKHFRHHYQDSTKDFGVSSSLWDFVLGTNGPKTGNEVRKAKAA